MILNYGSVGAEHYDDKNRSHSHFWLGRRNWW